MAGTRAVDGLKFALRCEKPGHFGPCRARGAKAHGIRYERGLAKALPEARHGQWWQFVDRNGLGHCQTDLLLEFPEVAFVLEAKYTWTPAGHFQVERLYRPVVARALGKPAFGLVVCRALRTEGEMQGLLVVSRLMEALAWCQKKSVVLHWLGEAPFLRVDPGTRLGAPITHNAPVLVTKRKAG